MSEKAISFIDNVFKGINTFLNGARNLTAIGAASLECAQATNNVINELKRTNKSYSEITLNAVVMIGKSAEVATNAMELKARSLPSKKEEEPYFKKFSSEKCMKEAVAANHSFRNCFFFARISSSLANIALICSNGRKNSTMRFVSSCRDLFYSASEEFMPAPSYMTNDRTNFSWQKIEPGKWNLLIIAIDGMRIRAVWEDGALQHLLQRLRISLPSNETKSLEKRVKELEQRIELLEITNL